MALPHPQRAFQVLLHRPEVQALLDAAGSTPCHLVGGALRDLVLGLPFHDVDAVVAGRGAEIAGLLAASLPARLVLLGGKEFAAYRLVGEEVVLDLWDRGEATLAADLARRDFTVNSFAWEPRGGAIADPHGGLTDLARRVLRATTPESFAGDPLRVLRLPRLAVQLPGFAAEPATLGLARKTAGRLSEVAAERVRVELTLLLAQPEAHRGIALLAALDLYPGLWRGRPGEPGSPAAAAGAVREMEALPGCRQRLRELAPEDSAATWTVDEETARLAILFANLAADGGDPTSALRRCRDAGYVTRAAATDVSRLLAERALAGDEAGRRRFLHRWGPLWATAACFLGARAVAQDREAAWLQALALLVDLVIGEGPALFEPPRLLTGEDVQELLAIPPGREVGVALAALEDAQVEGTVRSREEAVELVKRMKGC